jgi:hypothetical protein
MGQNLLNQLSAKAEIGSRLDLWLQIFLLVVVVFYAIFAFIVYKQVGILNDTISTPKAGLLRQLAGAHLAATLVVLVVLIFAAIF